MNNRKGEPLESYLRERKLFRREFSASLMSNSKWRKLIFMIENHSLDIPCARLKFIDTCYSILMRTPTRSSLHPPKPFFDTIEFGLISFCSIEWMEFPSFIGNQKRISKDRIGASEETVFDYYNGRRGSQDIDRAERMLSAGQTQFPIQRQESGLRIVGHMR